MYSSLYSTIVTHLSFQKPLKTISLTQFGWHARKMDEDGHRKQGLRYVQMANKPISTRPGGCRWVQSRILIARLKGSHSISSCKIPSRLVMPASNPRPRAHSRCPRARVLLLRPMTRAKNNAITGRIGDRGGRRVVAKGISGLRHRLSIMIM